MENKKMVEYRTLRWGPCVIHLKIEEDFRKRLFKEARKSAESHGSRLAGHIKKEAKLPTGPFKKDFDELFTVYNHAIANWTGSGEPPEKYMMTELWCNFQKANEFNPPHDHGGALSFVIYLDIPGAIKKENANFKKIKKQSAGPGGIVFECGDADRKNSIAGHSIFPENGDCYIFPAWLKHWVYPYQSDCTRVSVSGNVVDNIPLTHLEVKGKNGKVQ